MVARISFPKRLHAALNYNEKKCSKGNAECLAAVNYLLDATEMNFHQKLSTLELRNELNERATTKTIHISLNFGPSENLSKEMLCLIAEMYMKGIGFEQQPYLVYQHYDAGHPHLHIVSTTIKEDGTRINTHNLGRNQSEKVRKEIEEGFGLVKAEKQKKTSRQLKPLDAEKIIYGKSELKRSISNVVSYVFNNYKFSSLPEYNAALKQFNVIADRGKEDGRIYKYRGLVYRVLDENGNKVGVSIKASSIACQPTVDNLEKKFTMDKSAGPSFEDPMRTIANAIDEAIRTANSPQDLVNALNEKNIYTVLRQNDDGRIYGITFVDNEHKVVFNGSDLGKGYSAAGLMKKLSTASRSQDPMQTVTKRAMDHEDHKEGKQRRVLSETVVPFVTQKEENALDVLLSAEQQQFNNIPFQLRRKKKKKKNKLNY